jgi:hypothetical protein
MINIHNKIGEINDNQSMYDNYNNFLMSNDRDIFFKLCSRFNFFNLVKELNGDIVECGVFKGAGMFVWLKLINMYQPHSIKKVIGFDFFDNDFVNEIENPVDRDAMKQVFSRDANLKKTDISIKGITKKFLESGFTDKNFELIEGDISNTSKKFIMDRPGFRISLLYLDLDLDKPTYDTLCNFWERIVSGGIIVFDEYAFHSWSEANAVDRFLKEKNLKLVNTHLTSPTAFIRKE